MTRPKQNDTLNQITRAQRAWATRSGKLCDEQGYCLETSDNVFQPLNAQTEAELRSGDGGELGTVTKRGKFQAVHSSSALACNFFDYWRARSLTPLANAFQCETGFRSMAMERKFPNGVSRYAPNLDVVFERGDGGLLAVESKFTEPYRASNKNQLRDGYFKSPVWRNAGLNGCQKLAVKLTRTARFHFLDAAQLLKHMLGLAHSADGNWTLCYLWLDPGGEEAELHAQEITDFTRSIVDDASAFQAITYQVLFSRLSLAAGNEHGQYLAYLRDRYFPAAP